MTSLFVDANVVLEVLLMRPGIQAAMEALANREGYASVSPLTVHLCYYYCGKGGVKDHHIKEYLKNFFILTMDNNVVKLAQDSYHGKDFEDCMQAACAELGGCDEIITFDEKFKADSGTKLKVTVIS